MIAYPIGKVRRSLMAFRTEEITFGCHGRFCVFARPPRPQVHGPLITQPLFEATLLQVHHLCFCRKKKPLRKFKMAKTLRATKRFPMSKRQPGLQLQHKVFAPHGLSNFKIFQVNFHPLSRHVHLIPTVPSEFVLTWR